MHERNHILITKRNQSSVTVARTYRETFADSDHFMVILTLQHGMKSIKSKWNEEKLNEHNEREK